MLFRLVVSGQYDAKGTDTGRRPYLSDADGWRAGDICF